MLKKKLLFVISTAGMLSGCFQTYIYAEENQYAVQIEETHELSSTAEYEVEAVEIGDSTVVAGETQNIKIKVSGDIRLIDNAVLRVYADNKDVVEAYAFTDAEDGYLVFNIPYVKENQADKYTIKELILTACGNEQKIVLNDSRFDLAYFVTVNGNEGNFVNSDIGILAEHKLSGKNEDDNKFIIVIDPGHDPGCNDRAWVNGVWEPEMNWQIASAMKEELEKYEVEVYINREWDECPGQTDYDDMSRCIFARAERANELNADLFVSLHNNAAGMGELQYTADGSTVFVSKYTEYFQESVVLGEMIMDKLSELGIRQRGVKVRDYGTDSGTYDDGTEWDYYGVIRYNTMNHIPAILIEHAFMDNPTDLVFLKNKETLKKMGQKDAEAIAEYYDLDLKMTNQTKQVQAFVTRLYKLVLGREPEKAGLKAWTQQLIEGKNTGAQAADGFIFSDEFISKSLDNETFVDILYRTCLGREPDKGGRNAWVDLLEVPFSRKYVLKGFIESKEFTEICESYGIKRGSIELSEARDQNDDTTRFVARCYEVFLDRKPDAEGLNEWVQLILNNKEEARNVPYGFVFSKEMENKKLTDEAFISKLYEGILGRTADQAGLQAWCKKLQKGTTKEEIYKGFVDSREFTQLLGKYGL